MIIIFGYDAMKYNWWIEWKCQVLFKSFQSNSMNNSMYFYSCVAFTIFKCCRYVNKLRRPDDETTDTFTNLRNSNEKIWNAAAILPNTTPSWRYYFYSTIKANEILIWFIMNPFNQNKTPKLVEIFQLQVGDINYFYSN